MTEYVTMPNGQDYAADWIPEAWEPYVVRRFFKKKEKDEGRKKDSKKIEDSLDKTK